MPSESNAFSCRCRCRVPPPLTVKAAAHRFQRRSVLGVFHQVGLAIEEIRRIPAIEGEWLETLEGREQCRSPLPTIPEQVSHTKGALRLRKSANRSWIPSLEIKIPQLVAWRCATPRVRIFSLVLRTISGAMPLRFRWQLLIGPT